MGMQGVLLKDEFFFQPGLQKTYTFHITTNAGFTQDYQLYVRMQDTKVDLTPYVNLSTYYVEDLPTGTTYPFTTWLKLPEERPPPGIHEIRVGATETQNLGGGQMGARTAAEARIIVKVLFPTEYARINFVAPNGNTDSHMDFLFNIENYGEPDIDAKGRVEIRPYDSDVLIGIANTDAITLKSTDVISLPAGFNTTGLKPGTYRAKGILRWGKDNITEAEKVFNIGSKEITIEDFTKEFPQGGVHKAIVDVKSGWGNPMENVFALVIINDDVGTEMARFQTVSKDLKPWQRAQLEGFLDTSDFQIGTYDAEISVTFEGAKKTDRVKINITEPAPPAPKEEKEDKEGISATVVLLIIAVALLAILVIVLAMLIMKRRE